MEAGTQLRRGKHKIRQSNRVLPMYIFIHLIWKKKRWTLGVRDLPEASWKADGLGRAFPWPAVVLKLLSLTDLSSVPGLQKPR